MNAYPSHIFIVFTVAVVYTIVNATYVLTGGHVIYPGITWTDLSTYLTMLVTSIIVGLTFLLGYYVYHKVKKDYIIKSSSEKSLSTMRLLSEN